jgi:hypothetical protein
LDANIAFFISTPLTIDPGGGLDITGTCEGTNWLPRIAIENHRTARGNEQKQAQKKKAKEHPAISRELCSQRQRQGAHPELPYAPRRSGWWAFATALRDGVIQ